MNIDGIAKALEGIKNVKHNLDKFGIFNHDTLDEADPRKERIRSDITIEIGGPSTHIQITVLTRDEHTKIKSVMAEILNSRLALHQANLLLECKKLATQI